MQQPLLGSRVMRNAAVKDQLLFRPPADLNWDDDEAVLAWATAVWHVCLDNWGETR